MDTIDIQRVAAMEDDHWWLRERRKVLAGELRRIGRPDGPRDAVDIGAGGGGNTRVLLEHGWRALAVDICPVAVELARGRGLPARRGDARYLPLGSGSYDLALAMDVLPHIEDDARAAAEIARVLRPGGAALVTVPADPSLWSTHDVVLGHVRRYTRGSLAAALERGGLAVEAMWSWNVLLRPVMRRRRRNAVGSDLHPVPSWLNAGLRAALALERRLPVAGLPGASLIARVRRPSTDAARAAAR